MGLDYRGQIAIDDTAIVPGDCPMQPAYTGRSGITYYKIM